MRLRLARRKVEDMEAKIDRNAERLLDGCPRNNMAWGQDLKFAATARMDKKGVGGEDSCSLRVYVGGTTSCLTF